MTRRIVLAAYLVLATCLPATLALAADSPQFRGPERDGKYQDTGLLRSWPEDGPKLLWSYDGLGESYASVSVEGDRLYTTGKTGNRGVAYALDTTGKVVWRQGYGEEHSGNGYPGTRTTPTIDGDTLYLMTSMGKAVAMSKETGEVRWEADLLARYQGKNLYFAIAESPLVLPDKVIYTPGGKDASIVALDKKTGETVWTTKGLSDTSAYCSPRLFEDGDLRQVITFVESHLVGIDPESGEVLWRVPSKVDYGIHAVSPVFAGRKVYVSHGYGQGGKMFELAADGRSVKELWSDDKLDVHHGGAIFLDGHVYGAADNKTWHVLSAETGDVVASIPRLGKGVVVWADGLLYGYTEGGDVVLVNPDPKDFKVISSFKVTRGSGQHWSHPVVAGGVLYVRHGEVLMAFDVKADVNSGP